MTICVCSTMMYSLCAVLLLPALTIAPPPPSDFPTSNWGNEMWQWDVKEYPHPYNDSRGCNRYKPSYVCDPDMVLEIEQANELDVVISNIRNNTMCICKNCVQNDGIKFSVAIMKKLKLPYNQSLRTAVEEFAEGIRKKWAMSHCEDDVLIMVAITEKQVYVDAGSAAAQMIPAKARDQIFWNHKALFSSGNYYKGLYNMLDDYYTLLLRLQHSSPTKSVNTGSASAGLIVGIAVGIIALVVLVIGVGLIYRRRNDSDAKEDKPSKHSLFNFRKEKPPRPFFIGNPSPAVYQPCQTSAAQEDEGKNTEDEDLEEVTPKTLLTAPEAKEGEVEKTNVDSSTLPLKSKVEIMPEVEIMPIDEDKDDLNDRENSTKIIT